MLTSHDLAVLRAAVAYFEEELGPHGVESMRPYFADPVPETWSTRDLTRLREFLSTRQLRYVAYDQTSLEVVDTKLYETVSELQALVSTQDCRVASILINPVA